MLLKKSAVLLLLILLVSILPVNAGVSEDLIKKGHTLYEGGNYEEAVKCYDKATEGDPKNPQIWLEAGNFYYSLAEFQKSIECYNKSIELKPDFTDALLNKSLAIAAEYQLERWQEDRYREGKECLEQILKLHSDLSDINVNEKYMNDMTLLHMASYYGNKKMAEMLIDRGANVNAKDYKNFTPLFMALSFSELLHIIILSHCLNWRQMRLM